MSLERVIAAAREAITQMLDDGRYIVDYHDKDVPEFNTEKDDGGCFCHAAAEKAIQALAALPEQPMTEDELAQVILNSDKCPQRGSFARKEDYMWIIRALKQHGALFVREEA